MAIIGQFTNGVNLPGVIQVPIASLNAGSGASASTFLRGDNTWATPAGGGGMWSYVSTNSEVGAAIPILGLSANKYYIFKIVKAVPATDDVLWMEASSDNGSTWSSAAIFEFICTGGRNNGGSYTADNFVAVNDPIIRFGANTNVESTSLWGLTGEMQLFTGNASPFFAQGQYNIQADDAQQRSFCSANCTEPGVTVSFNAFRIKSANDYNMSGTVYVYELVTS